MHSRACVVLQQEQDSFEPRLASPGETHGDDSLVPAWLKAAPEVFELVLCIALPGDDPGKFAIAGPFHEVTLANPHGLSSPVLNSRKAA